MKKSILLIGMFLNFLSILPAQVGLNATVVQCNAVSATLTGKTKSLIGKSNFNFLIERQIAPGVWSKFGSQTNTLPEVSFESLPAGNYRVSCVLEYLDKFGQLEYSADDKIVADLVQISKCVGSRSNSTSVGVESILISPNPANDYVHCSLNAVEIGDDIKFELFDLMGNRVLSENLVDIDQKIDISTVGSGAYTLRIVQGEQPIYQQKLIKMNKN